MIKNGLHAYLCPYSEDLVAYHGLTLGNITQVKKLEMSYANYEMSIVQAYSVQLTGWPLDGHLMAGS
jgi:hypothetical protein